MPLALPTMPNEVLAVLQPKLHGWAASPSGAPKIIKPIVNLGNAAPVEVAGALAIFSLPPSALSGADPLALAKPIGWRCPVTSAGAPPVWIDFADGLERGALPTLTQINQTPFQANLVAAQAAANANAVVGVGNYTAAVLEIPALYQIALWLKDAAGKADLLIPIASQYAELRVGATCAAAEYLGIARTILEARAEARGLEKRPAAMVSCP